MQNPALRDVLRDEAESLIATGFRQALGTLEPDAKPKTPWQKSNKTEGPADSCAEPEWIGCKQYTHRTC
jgi:hypothetical protein